MLRLVINLKRSPERWNAIKTQLDRLQIPVRRIEAVDGRELSVGEMDGLCLPEDRFLGRRLQQGEIGGFLSHRKCWQELLDSQEQYALVLEDDLLLSERSPLFMLTEEWIPKDCHLIQLFVFRKQKKYLCTTEEYELSDGEKLCRPVYPTPVGAQAYIISREAAFAAVKESEKFNLPVDEFLFARPSFTERFPCYRLERAVAMDADVPSDIARNKDKGRRSFLLNVVRFVDRMQKSIDKKAGKMTGKYVERTFEFE